jgi:hypothetical protein
MPFTIMENDNCTYNTSMNLIISNLEKNNKRINMPLMMRFEPNNEIQYANPKDALLEHVYEKMFTSEQRNSNNNQELLVAISNVLHHESNNCNYKMIKTHNNKHIILSNKDNMDDDKIVIFVCHLHTLKKVRLFGISIMKGKLA